MILSEDDDRFYVAPSTIPGAGDGVFARVALEPGARLRVVGVFVRAGTSADRCTRYADEHKYRIDDLLLIPCGFGAMVNHSSTPNARKAIETDAVYLETLRAIAPGEELCFSYRPEALERFGLGSQGTDRE